MDGAHCRAADQLPANGGCGQQHRLVDRLRPSVRIHPVHARQLRAGAHGRGLVRRLPQQSDRHHPRHCHPDNPGRLRRLRICLDQVPWAKLPLRDGGRAPGDSACRCRWSHCCGSTATSTWSGSFVGVWLAHTGFGLPLAIYLLYNYISQLPKDIFESAYIDGATPFTAFTRLVHPAVIPGPGFFRNLPVPLGLERPAGIAGVSRDQPGCRGPDRSGVAAGRKPRGGLAPSHRRSLHLDGRTSDRVPIVAALLRARSPGGLGQGLNIVRPSVVRRGLRIDRVRRDHGRRSDRRADRRPPCRRGHPLRIDQHRGRRTDPPAHRRPPERAAGRPGADRGRSGRWPANCGRSRYHSISQGTWRSAPSGTRTSPCGLERPPGSNWRPSEST